jgi:acetyl esterase/lipase
MKYLFPLCLIIAGFALRTSVDAQIILRDLPYTDQPDPRQKLDVYSPGIAKHQPVVFWIHGGGWVTGDKSEVKIKPQYFMDKGFVFVSINYRLLPGVDIGVLTRDVAKAFGWMEKHIAEYGGDPKRVLVAGHSAGAQLAALLCTDEKYLKEQGVFFDVIKGCMPVDGDTYDVPAIVAVEDLRLQVHGMPPRKFGHRQKFGTDPDKMRDFSAVTHATKGKGIPPFLILYVAYDQDTTAQAFRLNAALTEAGVPARLFGANRTEHFKLNDDIGLPDDPATKALNEFLAENFKPAN